MRTLLFLVLLAAASTASAQIYRWVDEKGKVHYSNATPPAGAKAKVVDADARPGPVSPESAECYTVRCQGERLERRQAQRDELETRLAAERAAAAPKRPRGLDFRNYISIQRGMTEGEMLGYAGPPDLASDEGFAFAAAGTVQTGPRLRNAAVGGFRLKTYTYLPTTNDPFTTTITVVGGRVSEIERVRKF